MVRPGAAALVWTGANLSRGVSAEAPHGRHERLDVDHVPRFQLAQLVSQVTRERLDGIIRPPVELGSVVNVNAARTRGALRRHGLKEHERVRVVKKLVVRRGCPFRSFDMAEHLRDVYHSADRTDVVPQKQIHFDRTVSGQRQEAAASGEGKREVPHG